MTISLSPQLASFREQLERVCAAFPDVDRLLGENDLEGAIAKLHSIIKKMNAVSAREIEQADALRARAAKRTADAARVAQIATILDLMTTPNGTCAEI